MENKEEINENILKDLFVDNEIDDIEINDVEDIEDIDSLLGGDVIDEMSIDFPNIEERGIDDKEKKEVDSDDSFRPKNKSFVTHPKATGSENVDIEKINDSVVSEKQHAEFMKKELDPKNEKRKALVKLYNYLGKVELSAFSKKFLEQNIEDETIGDVNKMAISIKKYPLGLKIDLNELLIAGDLKDLNYRGIIDASCIAFGINPKKVKFVYTDNASKIIYIINKDFLDTNKWLSLFKKIIDNGDPNDEIILGINLLNNEIVSNSAYKYLHYRLLGATGSGKTVMIIKIALQFLMKQDTNVIFVEKGNDVDELFIKCSDMIYKTNVDALNTEGIISIFSYLYFEMEKRKKIFAKEGVPDIKGYNKKMKKEGKPICKRILFIVDEYGALAEKLSGNSKQYDLFIGNLDRILKVARSYGIMLFIATQTPQIEGGIPSKISGNLITSLFGKLGSTGGIKNLSPEEKKLLTSKFSDGDWIMSSIGGSEKTMLRSGFFNNSIDELVDEGYILSRPEEEQRKIIEMGIDNASKSSITATIEDLASELGESISYLKTDRMIDYGIDTVTLGKIRGLNRISFTILINILIEWFEGDVEYVMKEVGEKMTTLDIERKTTMLSEIKELNCISMPLLLSLQIFEDRLKGHWKKVESYGYPKVRNEDDVIEELVDNTVDKIKHSMVSYINKEILSMGGRVN